MICMGSKLVLLAIIVLSISVGAAKGEQEVLTVGEFKLVFSSSASLLKLYFRGEEIVRRAVSYTHLTLPTTERV